MLAGFKIPYSFVARAWIGQGMPATLNYASGHLPVRCHWSRGQSIIPCWKLLHFGRDRKVQGADIFHLHCQATLHCLYLLALFAGHHEHGDAVVATCVKLGFYLLEVQFIGDLVLAVGHLHPSTRETISVCPLPWVALGSILDGATAPNC